MSTKFYWLPRQVDNYKKLEKSDPKIYIGKRLVSGLFVGIVEYQLTTLSKIKCLIVVQNAEINLKIKKMQ